MEYIITTKYKVSFIIEACWPEEDGMGQEQFGGEVQTLDEALKLWEYAKVVKKDIDWDIICYPEIINKVNK